jgi:hypothetical protein
MLQLYLADRNLREHRVVPVNALKIQGFRTSVHSSSSFTVPCPLRYRVRGKLVYILLSLYYVNSAVVWSLHHLSLVCPGGWGGSLFPGGQKRNLKITYLFQTSLSNFTLQFFFFAFFFVKFISFFHFSVMNENTGLGDPCSGVISRVLQGN